MDAFAITPDPVERRREIDGAFECHLPFVTCTKCGKYAGSSYLEYPGLEAPSEVLAHKGELPWEVTWTEFEQLSRFIKATQRAPDALYAGAGIGEWLGDSTGQLNTVSWAMPWIPLFDKSLVRSLEQLGFRIPCGKATVRIKGKLVETHVIPQCGFDMMFASDLWQTLQLFRCDACGNIYKKNFKPMPQDGYRFLLKRWPRWPSWALLVKPLENPAMIIVHPDLAQALQSLAPPGLLLKHVGIYE